MYVTDCLLGVQGLPQIVAELAMVGATHVSQRPQDCCKLMQEEDPGVLVGTVQHAPGADAMKKHMRPRLETEALSTAVGGEKVAEDDKLQIESQTTIADLQQQMKAMQTQLTEMQKQLDAVKSDAERSRRQHDKALESDLCWKDYSVIFLAALVSVCYWMRLI